MPVTGSQISAARTPALKSSKMVPLLPPVTST
jgi:hypothetical protein